eukprot:gene1732-33142_t
MSDGILSKIDTMGSKVDELEKSIGEIMEQADSAEPPSAKQ